MRIRECRCGHDRDTHLHERIVVDVRGIPTVTAVRTSCLAMRCDCLIYREREREEGRR